MVQSPRKGLKNIAVTHLVAARDQSQNPLQRYRASMIPSTEAPKLLWVLLWGTMGEDRKLQALMKLVSITQNRLQLHLIKELAQSHNLEKG